jgi:adenosylcobinamide-GDP ribazoletransferase
MLQEVLTALTLLTVIPVKPRPLAEGETWNGSRSLAWFPLIGLVISGLLLAAHFLLQLIFPTLVVAILVVALWAVLTGGLHLDGFTDACDALFVPVSRARRLEILHDVHLGAFGATALALLLILKTVSVASLAGLWPLLLAPILGRWAIVYAATFPLARQEGMGAMFRAGLSRREVAIATVITAIAVLAGGYFGLIAFVAVFLCTLGLARLALSRIGGLSGDIYGTVCETAEVVVLLLGTLTVTLAR